MEPSEIDPKSLAFVRFVTLGIFLFAVAVSLTLAGSWVAMLLSFAGMTHWPSQPSVKVLVMYFMLSFSVVCATLWVGSAVEIIRMKEKAQELIGRAFVAAALGAVVTAFIRIITS